jgi:hypothetical protein
MASRKIPKSKEEKVALSLSEIVNDYNLDISEVGRYFARVAPLVSYNRFLEIIEIAELEKDNQYDRINHHPLF